MPLRKNADVGSPTSSRTPPTSGPTTIVRLSSAENRPFAAASSFSSTTSGVSAPAAGRYGRYAIAERAVRASSTTSGPFIETTVPIRHISTAETTAETTITRVRSYRSATTPPNVASSSPGIQREAVVAATQVAEPVRSYT